MPKAKEELSGHRFAGGTIILSDIDAIAPHGDGTAIFVNGATVVVTETPSQVKAVLNGDAAAQD